ncbi:hypothetical protein CC1G_00667 [Coprinopsis cinerea okayama7|uniref:Uncharacterized protein n=1 Tax=Coprinopsis cinerea (strain Okayama-7 / 130 / ATCC MYA-4618 / FGSC 9003) TaxID=240176 RepID=A8N3M2_COPC7|nr:hypothetical protein CC1G_00667 [Coprinopsis cinerea okayama7\|eukprot:XP_001829488.2 hypothetical protein CC1G_00667 [Coprinopsis cinerea okayama7\
MLASTAGGNDAKTPALSLLPSELLHEILGAADLASSTLFTLALSSRSFYHTALSLYLAKIGCPHPRERITLAPPSTTDRCFDALTALRLPFFVDETEELVFISHSMDDPFLHHIARLQSTLGRLRRFRRVVLKWKGRRISGPPPSQLSSVYPALGLLLNTILEKGCESLEIHGLNWTSDECQCIPVFPSKSVLTTAVSSVRRILGLKQAFDSNESVLDGRYWKYRVSPGKTPLPMITLSTSAREKTCLRTLTIDSYAMWTPPLLQWLYSTLLTSPVEELKLANFQLEDQLNLSWFVASSLFSEAAPHLKRLGLGEFYYPSIEELNKWVSSFQQLTSLTIDKLDLPWYAGLRRPAFSVLESCPALPNLEELRVDGTWFANTFKAFTEADFPNLRRLTIVTRLLHLSSGTSVDPFVVALKRVAVVHAKEQNRFTITMEWVAADVGMFYAWTVTVGTQILGDWVACISHLVLRLGRSQTFTISSRRTSEAGPPAAFSLFLARFVNAGPLQIISMDREEVS